MLATCAALSMATTCGPWTLWRTALEAVRSCVCRRWSMSYAQQALHLEVQPDLGAKQVLQELFETREQMIHLSFAKVFERGLVPGQSEPVTEHSPGVSMVFFSTHVCPGMHASAKAYPSLHNGPPASKYGL